MVLEVKQSKDQAKETAIIFLFSIYLKEFHATEKLE